MTWARQRAFLGGMGYLFTLSDGRGHIACVHQLKMPDRIFDSCFRNKGVVVSKRKVIFTFFSIAHQEMYFRQDRIVQTLNDT